MIDVHAGTVGSIELRTSTGHVSSSKQWRPPSNAARQHRSHRRADSPAGSPGACAIAHLFELGSGGRRYATTYVAIHMIGVGRVQSISDREIDYFKRLAVQSREDCQKVDCHVQHNRDGTKPSKLHRPVRSGSPAIMPVHVAALQVSSVRSEQRPGAK
jgi:hypothetical protein